MSSATLEVPTQPATVDSHYHIFHADAHVLSGKLERPIQQEIEEQIPVSIQDRRGGHLTRVSEDFSVEGFVSYKRGLTRVSGSRSSKPLLGQKEPGWTTLSTSILEGLNVFEVITADRVVSQVSTDHAYANGHAPFVTFLGTQFRDLRVSGFTAKPILNLGIGVPTSKDQPPDILNTAFLEAVQSQNQRISNELKLPEAVRKRYNASLRSVEELLDPGMKDQRKHKETTILFSLVQDVEIEMEPGVEGYPIPNLDKIGNVLLIPEFGAVALGEVALTVERVKDRKDYEPALNGSAGSELPLSYSYELTMLKMDLGCIGQGTVNAGTSKSNGSTRP